MANQVFELRLPVFKQGDDMHQSVEDAGGDAVQGLLNQAEAYETAAQLCRRVAAVAKEAGSVSVEGDTHVIWVEGPEEALAGLVADGILYPMSDLEDE